MNMQRIVNRATGVNRNAGQARVTRNRIMRSMAARASTRAGYQRGR